VTERLTPREREAAALAAQGLPNRSVAQRMNTTEGTVKQYLHQVYGKSGLTGRGQLPDLVCSSPSPASQK
jgi:two-component system, NarL family, nitrate/nitrite response regulator NarL